MIKLIHHFLPFLLIFTLVLAVAKSFLVAYAEKDLCIKKCKIQSITMILAHLQLVFGIVLLARFTFSNPNWAEIMTNSASRYTFVEHPFAMLLAIILISIGKVKSKKIEEIDLQEKAKYTHWIRK